MRGVALVGHGGPEALQWREDLPEPVAGPGEAVVRVAACGINHLDLRIRAGMKGVSLPFPHVMGSDVCGTVEGTGERVVVFPGEAILGLARWGGYAEKVAVPEAHCLPWPESLPAPLAAAFPLVFTTAHAMLHARAQVQAGETVMVLAASSGVGTAAVQLAKAAGARVLAVVGNDDKAFRVKALGADKVIIRTKEDFVEASGKDVDLVIDPVGGEILAKALGALKPGGRLVTCAVTAGPTATLELRPFFMRRLSILGAYLGTREDLERALRLLQEGKVKPVVDTVFPMQEAAQAHRRLEEGLHFGKLVLAAP